MMLLKQVDNGMREDEEIKPKKYRGATRDLSEIWRTPVKKKEKEFWTTKQVGEMLGISMDLVQGYRKRYGTGHKVRRLIRYTRADIEMLRELVLRKTQGDA